jgi:hypothetical protein
MYTLAVTVASNKGTVILQDNFPAEGPFILTVLPGTTGTVVISDNQFGRIQADLTALVAALACTYTITMTPSDPLFTALSTAITPGGSLTSPLQYKGSIAVNTSFPLVAVVASGWMYHVTADVTDNAGATYTNTGIAFLAGDEIVWDGAAWIKTGSTLTNPLQYKGTVTNAASFPAPTGSTGVKSGHCYLVTAAVIDNDATKTNTNQVFTNGDTIQWNGSGWNILAPQSPFSFRGNISVNTDFPLLALVKTGHVYRVTAGCTDNAGVTYTNTGTVFLTGDIIVWYSNAWYLIQKAPSAATPAAVGTAAAGTSGRPSNDDHIHAHGNQLGGTLHDDVVAGGADGFMTGTQATTLIRVNDHTMAVKLAGLNCMVDENEVSAQLTGDVGKKFSPTHIVVTVATVTGTPATPANINVGTAADGAQILSNSALTGLILVGDTRMIPLSAGTFNLAGNATLYANVESAEATATVMTVDVWVHGILTTPT